MCSTQCWSVFDWMTDWLDEWMGEWVSEWVTIRLNDWYEHTDLMCVDCRDRTFRLVDSERPDWLMNHICSYGFQWLTVCCLTFSTFTNRGMSRGESNCWKIQCKFTWQVVCFLRGVEMSEWVSECVWIEYCGHTASGTTNQYVTEHFVFDCRCEHVTDDSVSGREMLVGVDLEMSVV